MIINIQQVTSFNLWLKNKFVTFECIDLLKNQVQLTRIWLILILFLISCNSLHGQNLIPNPTFSSTIATTNHFPNELLKSPIMPTDWEILAGNPDYFNNTKSTYLGFPLLNSTEPSGGKIGLRMMNSKNEPEAIQTKLSHELIKGQKYKISFTLAQCRYSNYSMNTIPFMISNQKLTLDLLQLNDKTELCVLQTNRNYIASDGWVQVSFIYEAKGGEKYMTLLNNFYNSPIQEKSKSNRMPFMFMDNQLVESSYYFYNRVTLEPINDESNCKTIELSTDLKALENATWENFNDQITAFSNLETIDINLELGYSEILTPHHVFLIDISGSIKNFMDVVINESIAILKRIKSDEPVSLVVFNETSQIVYTRTNKENIMSEIRKLTANGKTSLSLGLNDMSALIAPNELTILEIFTDEIIEVKRYCKDNGYIVHSNGTNYYAEYKVYDKNGIKNISKDPNYKEFIKYLYTRKNVAETIKFSAKTPQHIQYSKECESTNNLVSDANNTNEKSTNFVYLIDVSASMNEHHKMDDLKSSILQYNKNLDGSSNVSLVSFASFVTILLNSVQPKNPIFESLISELQGKGSTKIDEGIHYIYSNYSHSMSENLSFILFTDGEFTLSQASEKIILENPLIHLTIFQFGDRKSKKLTELTENRKLLYRKVKPANLKKELIHAEKEFPFPKKYSLEQPGVWKYFQNNILEITSKGY